MQVAAVVAKQDDKWGETRALSSQARTRERRAHRPVLKISSYKCPRYVVFAEILKTSTGKIQKFKLREMAKTV